MNVQLPSVGFKNGKTAVPREYHITQGMLHVICMSPFVLNRTLRLLNREMNRHHLVIKPEATQSRFSLEIMRLDAIRMSWRCLVEGSARNAQDPKPDLLKAGWRGAIGGSPHELNTEHQSNDLEVPPTDV